MAIRPGLLFCGRHEVIAEYHSALCAQDPKLQKIIRDGDIKEYEKALAEGTLGAKAYQIVFTLSDGATIEGSPDPAISSITCSEPRVPSTWTWHFHLAERNDETEIRFFRVEVKPSEDLVLVRYIRIPRDSEPDFATWEGALGFGSNDIPNV